MKIKMLQSFADTEISKCESVRAKNEILSYACFLEIAEKVCNWKKNQNNY